MDQMIDTGFKDKTGRSIHVGDIVQHRLGKFGKSGGSHNLKVIIFGKKYHLVGESDTDTKYGGTLLVEKLCDNLVILTSDYVPK